MTGDKAPLAAKRDRRSDWKRKGEEKGDGGRWGDGKGGVRNVPLHVKILITPLPLIQANWTEPNWWSYSKNCCRDTVTTYKWRRYGQDAGEQTQWVSDLTEKLILCASRVQSSRVQSCLNLAAVLLLVLYWNAAALPTCSRCRIYTICCQLVIFIR